MAVSRTIAAFAGEVSSSRTGQANIKTTMGYAKLNARTKFVELQKMNTSGAGAGMEALAI